jgi:hypothetical protein
MSEWYLCMSLLQKLFMDVAIITRYSFKGRNYFITTPDKHQRVELVIITPKNKGNLNKLYCRFVGRDEIRYNHVYGTKLVASSTRITDFKNLFE